MRFAPACLTLALLAFGCRGRSPKPGPVYLPEPPATIHTFSFAVHPLHNPARLSAAYQPLIDHLDHVVTGAHFDLETSRDYGDFEAKIRSQAPAFLLPNPWQTLKAMEVGYEVIAIAGDSEDFKGIILVRTDSGIRNLKELRGKVVSYPSATAVAACLLPQSLFHAQGINVNRELINRYVGSQESTIMNVVLKLSSAGCTWPPPWRAFRKAHPDEAAQLRVLAETPHLLNNSVMVRKDVPRAIRDQAREILIHLHESPEGRRVLEAMETHRFHPAGDEEYEPVRRYIERFEREIRPVVQP
ncbi:MAG TPA: PhnD/SsuA/transferrin family substrate-binding protein [Holophagaceae bacterium]|nr:PhnD/SsuA/transferrin family substrate-binding protein [Holophagaceae bacterium]